MLTRPPTHIHVANRSSAHLSRAATQRLTPRQHEIHLDCRRETFWSAFPPAHTTGPPRRCDSSHRILCLCTRPPRPPASHVPRCFADIPTPDSRPSTPFKTFNDALSISLWRAEQSRSIRPSPSRSRSSDDDTSWLDRPYMTSLRLALRSWDPNPRTHRARVCRPCLPPSPAPICLADVPTPIAAVSTPCYRRPYTIYRLIVCPLPSRPRTPVSSATTDPLKTCVIGASPRSHVRTPRPAVHTLSSFELQPHSRNELPYSQEFPM
ncbi:hypothetical protein HYPSUDRAFT_209169 [Hypholoma sublateritium FD-334 SS-4]|uniref:Uncharacterized protein n=1 Tax=Hypholoma sublateritium (strain FD-334 SS-4) TaxID=945553 RepID=A0A0D2LSR7_HYPSF|nr:hypothetical protein HYPSUDRAFT_209169 [Hypholoma sublateritium FD-334 SS-4]